jgi:hypothetical protein
LRAAIAVALVAPLFLLRPGPVDLARGIAGRLMHFRPSPPAGWQRIPFDRAGIWTPPGDWFDSKDWGGSDDPATVTLIRGLVRGQPTFIEGNKASLYYFLADVPCAGRFTDLPSQCFTREDYAAMGADLARNRPGYIFVMESSKVPGPTNHYRPLGLHRGLFVYQRDDLPAITFDDP